jgi:fructose-bisphosphate aldolase class II
VLFTPMKELLLDAQRNHYAVPGFNAFNMESLQAMIEVASDEQAPIIVMAEQRDLLYAGLDYIYYLMKAAQGGTKLPAALHLDHGNDLEIIAKAIEIGFSSVMIDGSQLPYAENIKVTASVVEKARAKGVTVEAELGHVGGGGAEGSGASLLTDPAVVAEFVETTGVDALAVAIGTAHGVYTETPKLDFPRLKAIAQETDVPLVLHGGSGAPDDDLRQAIELGVCKINVGTDIRRAFVSTIVEVGQDSTLDVREVLTPAKNKMKEVIRERIRVFGASHRLKGD